MSFIPRMVAVDKFNRLAPEEWKETKKISASSIASNCPLDYFEEVIGGVPSTFPFEHARPGKEEHFFREHVNKHNPRALIIEKSLHLQFKGDGKIKPFILRVTPDAIMQGIDYVYALDYKTTAKKGWYFKYKYFKDGLPFGNKMQLSLQKYAVYLHFGLLIHHGFINFIMLNDDKTKRLGNEMKVHSDLFSFHEIEEFIFTHPAVTGDKKDITKATNKYHEEYKGLCKWKECFKCDDQPKLEEFIENITIEESRDFEGDY